MKDRKPGERGTALIGALLLVLIVSAGVGLVWRSLMQQRESQRHFVRAEEARQLAEAGLETAIAALRADRGYAGVSAVPLGEGEFSVAVFPATPGFRLESEGVLRDGAIVRARIRWEATLQLDGAGRIVAYAPREQDR